VITLTAPSPALQSLRDALRHERYESAAILLCAPVQLHRSGGWRLILRETHIAPASAYEERTPISARLKPEFGLPLEKKAREQGWSLVYVHTHHHDPASFSVVDNAAESALQGYADSRSPGVPHVALLLAPSSITARRLGTDIPVRVVELGKDISVLNDPYDVTGHGDQYDRQVRAFGSKGQRRVEHVSATVVGLGGTGSLVVQQLAHLGVRDYLLIDRDLLDATNLNRTVGATPSAVGESKVSVAERMIRAICPAARIQGLHTDVLEQGTGRLAAEKDVIFCCTDSHASRHLINQLSYQYLVPVIDMGVAIDARDNTDIQFAGHVQALSPGLPCLWCTESLDSRQVREEMMSPEHRNADPYFASGVGGPQPAVISINSTISSLAVTMFLSMLAGIPAPARHLIYDGNRSRVNSVGATRNSACNFCSDTSTALGGDAYPLPERRRVSS
jgi:molybdopterin/thiamine biosynthesis adenylyltransferase